MSRRRHALMLAAWLAPLTFGLAAASPLIAAADAAGGGATATRTARAVIVSTATKPAGATKPATAPAPPTATKPATGTSPAKGTLRLYLSGAFLVHGQLVTVPGRGVGVAGVMAPYVPGQWVSVRASVGRRLVKSVRLRVKPAPDGSYGRFTEPLTSPASGQLSVTVTHARSAQQVGLLARRSYSVMSASAGFGATGKFVQLIQQRLAALHIYVPQSGVYDEQTGLALDAYHRLLGWGTAQTLDGKTISYLLDGFGAFKVRDPGDGTHAEGNLSKQLLALVVGSRVEQIYPISSGKPSTPTVLGHFHVYERTPGYLPDGMYYSSFFIGGYAIHGYDPAPDYPASHGCMRLPIIDAISVFNWLNYDDAVDVYY